MNLLDQLTQKNVDPHLVNQVHLLIKQKDDLLDTKTQQLTHQTKQLQEQQKQIITQTQELRTAHIHLDALKFELARLRRIRFAKTSEAFPDTHQRELFEEDYAGDEAHIVAQIDQLTRQADQPTGKRRVRAGRQPLPDHLPRIIIRHDLDNCTCGQCGQDLVKIGEDVSEQLEIIPAQFMVHRHIRPQYACRTCVTMHAQPVAPAIIDGGMATPSLLAWIVISKYVDHLPLYRLEQIAGRDKVTLARSTLAQWVGKVGACLTPLVERLRELAKERRILHADETHVRQLDPGRGQTKRAYLWAYRTTPFDEWGPPIVVFDYQTSREGKHAQSFLDGWQGHLMVDAYGGYQSLFNTDPLNPSGIIELGCFAHVRRKFFELHAANKSPIGQKALELIRQLYAIEAQANTYTIKDRAELRAKEAQPLLEQFFTWLKSIQPNIAPGSATLKAIMYALNREQAILRYATRGDLPIDNNPLENAIRPIALGRKNWLFTGSELAGQRAAAIQSLLATAKANELEPFAWLVDTLQKLPTCLNSQIDSLLPLSTKTSFAA